MFVFRAAEGNVEREEERENQEKTERWSMSELRAATMQKHNMTAAEFNTLAGKIHETRETHDEYYDEQRWSYGESFWFVFVLLTTIGYGDFTPVTSLGKGLCVVYAFFGIPITILLLRFIGQQMLRGERSLITAIEKHCLGRNGAPSRLNEKCFLFGFVYLLLLLLIGAAIQMKVEGWSYGDSLYFYVVTFTTVGFGDLLPQEAKYITVPFILLGLTAISNILHAAAAVALIKRVTAGSQVNDETEKLTKKEAEV